MVEVVNRLEELIKSALDYFSKASEFDLDKKSAPEKWSKKEIIGHLVDSGINNLQRFTEIQFESKPYHIRNYNQNELVKANNYKNSNSQEIIDFWLSINTRILRIIRSQSAETLNYEVEIEQGNKVDFRFMIHDYVNHLEHHLTQIQK